MESEKSEDDTIYIDTRDAVHSLFTGFQLPPQIKASIPANVELPVGKSIKQYHFGFRLEKCDFRK